MLVESGKKYRTRDGRIVMVKKREDAPSESKYVFWATGDGYHYTVTAHGHEWQGDTEGHRDLVAEYDGLAIEAGKNYRTRGGDKAVVVSYDDNTDSPYVWDGGVIVDGNSLGLSWTKEGAEFADRPSRNDLVAEWTDLPTIEVGKECMFVGKKWKVGTGSFHCTDGHVELTLEPIIDPPLVLEAGKAYIRRDGVRVWCMATEDPSTPDTDFPVLVMETPADFSWLRANGKVLHRGDHSHDLVRQAD